MDRLATDTRAACEAIPRNCRCGNGPFLKLISLISFFFCSLICIAKKCKLKLYLCNVMQGVNCPRYRR